MFSHLLELPPLQNKPFWIYICLSFSLSLSLFPKAERPAGKSKLRIKTCVELWRSCALPPRRSGKPKREEWTAVLFGIHVSPRPAWLMHSVLSAELGSKQNLFLGATPRPHGRESLMPACVTLSWRHAIYPAGVYCVFHLCFYLSASLAATDYSGEHAVTSAGMRSCPISSGLPSGPACGFLDFTPQCEIIKLITSLERLLKEYTSKGSVFIQVFLSFNVEKKKGRMEKEQMRCSASCEICQWIQRKWAEGARPPWTFSLRTLMSGARFYLAIESKMELGRLRSFSYKTSISSF